MRFSLNKHKYSFEMNSVMCNVYVISLKSMSTCITKTIKQIKLYNFHKSEYLSETEGLQVVPTGSATAN